MTATAFKNLQICNKNLSSFELITNWLDTGYTLNLSSNALNLMTHLLRFYNPKKSVVFPKQETLSIKMNVSVRTVQRALEELLKANLIIKTRGRTQNKYAFTHHLMELLGNTTEENITHDIESDSCIGNNKGKDKQPHDHDLSSEPRAPKKVVVVNFTSKEDVSIPKCIKQNKSIRNKIAYWRSLSPTAKEEYIKKDKELERIEKRAKKDTRETKELLNSYQEMKETREAPTTSWLALKEKLQNGR